MLNNRDEQALAAIAEQYGALCRTVARDILGSEQDAEECLNDALLQIWNAIPPAQPENLCAYLMKTVRNHALNRYKAGHRVKRGGGQQAAALEELSELLPSSENVLSELERRELLAAISRFLQSLPAKNDCHQMSMSKNLLLTTKTLDLNSWEALSSLHCDNNEFYYLVQHTSLQ